MRSFDRVFKSRPGYAQKTLVQIIRGLFATGEQGVWYDPSDLSTLYQDAAGTIPVTAVEQPVGRILDKSGRGNHASQPTATSRPVLSARVNLLMKTEDFADAVWTASKTAGASVAQNTAIAPNGTLTADTVTFASASDYLYQGIASYSVKPGDAVALTYYSKTALRVIGFGGATPAGTDVHTYKTLTDGWYLHKTVRTFSITATGTLQIIPGGAFGAGAGSYILWGADFRPENIGTSLPDYQRVNSSTDYDTNGFPYYLRFDGTDDWLVTPSINFTSTDKVSLFAGLRKLSDAALGVVAELGATIGSNNGTFNLTAPPGVYPWVQYASRGTQIDLATATTSLASPVTVVATGLSNLSSPSTSLRINGITANTSAMSQGGGTYGNYPLYIGCRAGTSQPFNGHLYGLIIRGAATDDAKIRAVEKWVNSKTRAF